MQLCFAAGDSPEAFAALSLQELQELLELAPAAVTPAQRIKLLRIKTALGKRAAAE